MKESDLAQYYVKNKSVHPAVHFSNPYKSAPEGTTNKMTFISPHQMKANFSVSHFNFLIEATTTVTHTICMFFRRGAKMDHLQILDSLLKKDYDRRATPTNHLSEYLASLAWQLSHNSCFTFCIFVV